MYVIIYIRSIYFFKPKDCGLNSFVSRNDAVLHCIQVALTLGPFLDDRTLQRKEKNKEFF